MNEERIEKLSILALVIGTIMCYLSLLINNGTLLLLLSFLVGFFGIGGLFRVTKPNNEE